MRLFGFCDAEAAYSKDHRLAFEVAEGTRNRAIRALQVVTALRQTHERADKFIERWIALAKRIQRQYEIGDMTGRSATRNAMADMSLERDPHLKSILANRKRQFGVAPTWGSPGSVGGELTLRGFDLDRYRGLGL